MNALSDVFVSLRAGTCHLCSKEITGGDLILLSANKVEQTCLVCGGLAGLAFLPSGNVAMTKRATAASSMSAVVWKFSKARNRKERQGILVEPAALETARKQCNEDHLARAQNRVLAATKREIKDRHFIEQFTLNIRALYPSLPNGRELEIAQHACEKHSGKVGRTAAAKAFAKEAIVLAVRAHIRHRETEYDKLLQEMDRETARETVRRKVDEVESAWRVGR